MEAISEQPLQHELQLRSCCAGWNFRDEVKTLVIEPLRSNDLEPLHVIGLGDYST
jgi:hypothetical protein